MEEGEGSFPPGLCRGCRSLLHPHLAWRVPPPNNPIGLTRRFVARCHNYHATARRQANSPSLSDIVLARLRRIRNAASSPSPATPPSPPPPSTSAESIHLEPHSVARRRSSWSSTSSSSSPTTRPLDPPAGYGDDNDAEDVDTSWW